MRRGISALISVTALGALLAWPAGAGAAGVTRFTDHSISIQCQDLVSTAGTKFAFFGAFLSDAFGPDAFLDAWNSPTPSGQPDISRDYEHPAAVAWNGSTLSGSFPIRTSTGASAGSASFAATFTRVGDPVAFSDRIKDGNRWIRFDGTSQASQLEGTLTLTGGTTFDLANCIGDETTVTTSQSNPKSFVRKFQERIIGCDLSNAAGDTGFLFVDFGEGGGFIDSAVFPVGGPPNIGGVGGFDPTGGSVDTDLGLYNFDTGGPVAGSGHVSLTVAATGEPFTNLLRNATGRRMTRGQVFDVEGTLTLAGHVFDLSGCVLQDTRTKEINTAPHGPKPGGKPPANDLPSGARLIKVGSSTTQQTKSASPTAEAPFPCMTFEDPETGGTFEVPVGSTVWFSFTATGPTTTVDTAGSDFDTVLAIYTLSGSTYVPVAGGCVDDSAIPPVGRTLQGNVTIPTVAGTTYFVQIGGFPETFTYGNLKVAVR